MNENQTANKRTTAPGLYRPALRLYHANGKGTGSAVEMKLHPAHDNVDGCIMMRVANQGAVGDMRGSTPTFSRFDWEHSICVKLDFSDLSKMLQVFRGECESVDGDRGLYHQTSQASTKILFRHVLEPSSSYSLDMFRSLRCGGESVHARILLSRSEAAGICDAIAGVMPVVGFGIPMLVAHDTSAYRAEQREFRNAPAA